MIRARKGRTLSIITSMLGLVGCTNLEFLESNTCGNLVVESDLGEDCDGEAGCGAPRSAHECRFTCETDPSDCKEDLGYHCGADGVCRRPKGEFVPASTDTTATARDLLVGDVNADGCAEVIVSAMRSTTVHAFSSALSSSCVESKQTLQSNRPDPEQGTVPQAALADLEVTDDTGRLSLLSPSRSLYGDGLSLHFTSGGPTLAPVLFPRFIRGGSSVRTVPASFHGKSAIVLLEQASGEAASDVTLIFDPKEAPATFPKAYQGKVEDIAAIIAADVDSSLNSPPPANERCEEIIIARHGGSHLELYKVCTGTTTYGFTKLQNWQIALNAGVRSSNATIVATDVDGDGYTDLLTNTKDQKVHVAFGFGDGRFNSKPPGPMPPPIADQKADILNDPMANEAAKDGHLFVALEFDPNHPGIDYYAPPCPPQADFSSPTCAYVAGGCEAVVADIDADGDDDVIISEGQSVDIAVHRQNGGAFNVTFLGTACPPHNLGAGDFDGDGVVDVAFFDQTSKGPEANTTALSIAYGNAFAAPSAPIMSGRFDEANGLSVVHFGHPGTGAQIGITRSIGKDNKGSALAVVEVGNERAVVAPYYLTADIMGAQSLDSLNLVAQTAGLFRKNDESKPIPALAILTQSKAAYQLWLVESNEDAGSLRAAPRSESTEIPCTSHCVLAAISRGETDTNDLLLLGDEIAVIYGAVDGEFVEEKRITLKHSFTSLISATNPPKYAPRPLVEDIDDDEWMDVVALANTGALVGLFGAADGGFTEVELIGAPSCWGKAGCGNYAAAAIDVDGDAKPDLVIAGSELPGASATTSVMAYRATTRELSAIPGISIHAEKLRADADYVALGADDIDADGVTDLVFMPSSNYFTVLRGRPEHE
ncbi:MAG: VCBS repeat-containing protein [Polyangiaceae bacterium]|nr:VCBS repeat-containing protein [Polyangiaceae bacterium]